MQSLTDIAVFVKVVERSSFTAAAEALEMSQPVVSKAVTRLEEKLGARLLNRTTRRLSLTEAGSALYQKAAQALSQIEDAELDVAAFQTEPRGTLRVSAPASFAILHMGPLLAEFIARYPGVTMDFQLDDRTVDLVQEGFDLAIRIGELEDSTLIARRIAPCRVVVCAAPAYLQKRGTPQTPEDLLEHDCFVYTNLRAPREWRFIDENGELHVVPINGRLHSNNGLLERDAAIAGAGISRIPTFYVGEQLRSGALVPILPKYRAQPIGVYAVYPQQRKLLPKVRAFIDFLAERFGDNPAWDQGWSTDQASAV
jgi:DNA-binding transcriptional LysR family regulator